MIMPLWLCAVVFLFFWVVWFVGGMEYFFKYWNKPEIIESWWFSSVKLAWFWGFIFGMYFTALSTFLTLSEGRI